MPKRKLFVGIMVGEPVAHMFSKLALKEKKTKEGFLLALLELYRECGYGRNKN